MRFIKGDLVNAVQPGGDNGGGGAIQVAQAEPQQGAGIFRHVGMQAVAAKRDVGWSVVTRSKQSFHVTVRIDRADGSSAGVGNEKLVGGTTIIAAGGIGKAAGDDW
jgi:hypothetical protein